uniref:Uncharacterized protein n=1 Tax=Arundo donax TaxID=35708 RepID=A0A0A9BI24_ARUDO
MIPELNLLNREAMPIRDSSSHASPPSDWMLQSAAKPTTHLLQCPSLLRHHIQPGCRVLLSIRKVRTCINLCV